MHEPWKMLMSCALMIRCSSEAVKTRCIEVSWWGGVGWGRGCI
jgi:hypothetical protein